MFLYTDGVTEARAGNDLYGEERLSNLLSSFSGQTPADAVSGVVSDVVEHAGGHLRDDLEILAIPRIP